MPILPTFMFGLDLFGPPSLPLLPTEDTEQKNIFFRPWIGLNWENISLRSSLQTKQEHRNILIGEDEYNSQYGVTELNLGLMPVWYRKGKNVAFLHIGSFVTIPNIDIVSEAQTEEETLLIEQQLYSDLFSGGGLLGIGVQKNIDQFFFGTRFDQRFTWNPIYSDEFGTEEHLLIQSEVHVTFGWLL